MSHLAIISKEFEPNHLNWLSHMKNLALVTSFHWWNQSCIQIDAKTSYLPGRTLDSPSR